MLDSAQKALQYIAAVCSKGTKGQNPKNPNYQIPI
jgi:hypothetical protein